MKESLMQKTLDSLIEGFAHENYPDEDSDRVFALYAATQLLKPKSLSDDFLQAGLVDGPQDGGIDAVYVFLNGVPLCEDSPYLDADSDAARNIAQKPSLEAVVLQTKNKPKWEEAVWQKMMAALPVLLDPEVDETTLRDRYSNELIVQTGIFRRALQALSTRFPKTSMRIAYVARAPEQNISPAIEALRSDLESTLSKELFYGSELGVDHIGIATLYQLSSQGTERAGVIEFSELMRTDDAYVGLVKLEDYLNFLCGGEDLLEEGLFDANVRDFEGEKKDVNQSIAATLAQNDGVNFWWRNNGITILASDVDCPSKKMTLGSPLIVNGLQTSHVLFNARKSGTLDPSRLEDMIFVKVIVSKEDKVRDAVIAGTNRQIGIPSDALFASDGLQADIERFFYAQGWYYERRRNHYKNLNMPASRRVSILYLAQAVMTLALGEPNTARARPTTLLSKDDGYKRVFTEEIDCDGYLVAAKLMKGVDAFLQTSKAKGLLSDRTNTRFYIALVYYMLSMGIEDLESLHFAQNAQRITFPLDPSLLIKAIGVVMQAIDEAYASGLSIPPDTLAKRIEFRDLVVGKL